MAEKWALGEIGVTQQAQSVPPPCQGEGIFRVQCKHCFKTHMTGLSIRRQKQIF